MQLTRLELSALFLDSFEFLDYNDKIAVLSLCEDGVEMKVALSTVKKVVGEEKIEKVFKDLSNTYLNALTDELEREGITPLTKYSDAYPKYLFDVYSPPIVLYAKGNISLLKKVPRFAVVGSRKSTPTDKKVAEDFSKTLSENGVVLVTGIAEGIDSSVIKGSLKSGNIISVTAGGFDKVYPKENLTLFNSVENEGLCISEQRPHVKPMPYMYPYRNRLIAGLSMGVLVVSAGKKSGTLHTVSYALEQGKDVFAVPHSIGAVGGEGCNALIKSGAYLTDTPNDILDYFGIDKKEEKKVLLEGIEKEIFDIISNEQNIHIEKIAVLLKKRSYEIMPTLSMLEIKGLIVKSAGNVYSTITN